MCFLPEGKKRQRSLRQNKNNFYLSPHNFNKALKFRAIPAKQIYPKKFFPKGHNFSYKIHFGFWVALFPLRHQLRPTRPAGRTSLHDLDFLFYQSRLSLCYLELSFINWSLETSFQKFYCLFLHAHIGNTYLVASFNIVIYSFLSLASLWPMMQQQHPLHPFSQIIIFMTFILFFFFLSLGLYSFN